MTQYGSDHNHESVIAIPMIVSRRFFALLTRAGAKDGKTAPEFLAEKLSEIVQSLEEQKEK